MHRVNTISKVNTVKHVPSTKYVKWIFNTKAADKILTRGTWSPSILQYIFHHIMYVPMRNQAISLLWLGFYDYIESVPPEKNNGRKDDVYKVMKKCKVGSTRIKVCTVLLYYKLMAACFSPHIFLLTWQRKEKDTHCHIIMCYHIIMHPGDTRKSFSRDKKETRCMSFVRVKWLVSEKKKKLKFVAWQVYMAGTLRS